MDNLSPSSFRNYYYSDDHNSLFYQTLKQAAKVFGCHYISYVYEQPQDGVRMGFSTNPDWQKQYIGENLIDDCHLWKSVLKYFVHTNRPAYVLPWETVRPETDAQGQINEFRRNLEIGGNGVSFCTQNASKREFLAFAPASDEPNFMKHVVGNMDVVRSFAGVFRLATQESLHSISSGE